MQSGNLFGALPESLPQEITDTLMSGNGVRIERIVSGGQASPEGFWYDQNEHEWVVVLKGSAGLEIEGEAAIRVLKEGDYLLLAANQRHRVAWTDAEGETIWLEVFFRA